MQFDPTANGLDTPEWQNPPAPPQSMLQQILMQHLNQGRQPAITHRPYPKGIPGPFHISNMRRPGPPSLPPGLPGMPGQRRPIDPGFGNVPPNLMEEILKMLGASLGNNPGGPMQPPQAMPMAQPQGGAQAGSYAPMGGQYF